MALDVLPYVALLARYLGRIVVQIRAIDTALLAVEEPIFFLVQSLEICFVLLHHRLEMSLR